MRVLMTGATGFVGLNIVKALLDAGHEVVSLQRPGARRRHLDRFAVRVVTGELHDYTSLCAAQDGIEAVIHTAGNTSCRWRDIDALEAANVHGTRALLQAATACGVRRFVYTSTTSTIGSHHPRLEPADERTPLRGFRSRSPYGQTKQRAEALLLADHGGPECVVLNPAEVVGPYDHTLQWGRIVLAVAAGRLPFVPPGTGTFCPAADVAAAHVAALTSGRPGERYILGGHHASYAQFIDLVAEVVRQPAPRRQSAPYALMRAAAHVRERLPLLGAPAVDSYRMRVFGGHHLFNDWKARAELGYNPRPLRTAIEECWHWYLEHGYAGAAAAVTSTRKEWKTT